MPQEVEIKDVNEDAVIKEAVTGIIMATEDYLLQITDAQKEKIKKTMETMRDKRDDWISHLYFEIQKRMKLMSKNKKLDVKKIKINAHLIAFGNKFVEIIEFNPTPKQKTLEESTMGQEEMQADMKKKRGRKKKETEEITESATETQVSDEPMKYEDADA